MNEQNLIFLISQPRSGSTLLQRVLGTHNEIYTRSEPWIMLHSAYSLKQQGIETEYSVKTWRTAFNDFINNLPNDGEDVYIKELKHMHLNLYSKYINKFAGNFFLDKTPRYYLIIDELKRIFPNSKKIVLIRNPLSVLSSILLTWVKDDYIKLNNHKEDLFDAIDITIKELSIINTNVLFVKYENLLNDPKNELQIICNYIGIEFNDELLNFKKTDISNFVYGDPTNAKVKNEIDTKHSQKWIENINNPQIWRLLYDYLHSIGKKKFAQLGYNFEDNLNILLKYMPYETIELSLQSTKGFEEFFGKSKVSNNQNYNFSKQFNKLFESIEFLKNTNEKYVIYGYGTVGKTIKALIPEKIIDYVDIKDENHLPKNLRNMKYDKIIISVLGREDEIIKNLIEELNIDKEKFIIFSVENV